MTTWLLLERADDLLPNIFRTIDLPDFAKLFDSTELAVYSESSPLLVTDDGEGTLLQALKASPDSWPGLVIESECGTETLLEHLRHILIIRFEQTRKGMLRYWRPSVASYFFPACTDENLKTWLGPISRLSWYTASATQPEAQWQSLDNAHAKTWQSVTPNRPLMLGAEHCEALERHSLQSTSTGQES